VAVAAADAVVPDVILVAERNGRDTPISRVFASAIVVRDDD
jgi:hypothetical protein